MRTNIKRSLVIFGEESEADGTYTSVGGPTGTNVNDVAVLLADRS